jgi:integrase
MCDRYMTDARAGMVLSRGKPKKQSTLYNDQGRIERHIKPLLGNRRIGTLQQQEVERFMRQVNSGETAGRFKGKPQGLARVRGGPGTAARCVALLAAIYSYAIRMGWAADNPCRGVELPAHGRRDRYLAADEYRTLNTTLDYAFGKGMNPIPLAAIRAMMLTGCRRNEILHLRWADIDMEGRCLRLPDTKTGPQIRPCGQTALAFLDSLERWSDKWVFPSLYIEGAITNIRKPLVQVLDLAGLPHAISPHVFRHSYATVAHELNYSELTISGLLGHRAGSVTARYAHHVDSALADAADRVSALISERMGK